MLLPGNITISSPDTSDAPVINTNTLGSATDQAVAVALFKRMRALVSTKAMAPIMGPEISPGTAVQSDAQILQWLLANVGPGYHAACTCKCHSILNYLVSMGLQTRTDSPPFKVQWGKLTTRTRSLIPKPRSLVQTISELWMRAPLHFCRQGTCWRLSVSEPFEREVGKD